MKVVLVENKEKGKFVHESLGENIVMYFSKEYTAVDTLKNIIYIFNTSSICISDIMNDSNIKKYVSIPLVTLKKYEINVYDNVIVAGELIKKNDIKILENYRDRLIRLRETLDDSELENDSLEKQKVTNGAQIISYFIFPYLHN